MSRTFAILAFGLRATAAHEATAAAGRSSESDLKTVCCYSSSKDCDSPGDSCSSSVGSCQRCDGKLYMVNGSMHTLVEVSKAGQNATASADAKDADAAQNALAMLAADIKGDDRFSHAKASQRSKPADRDDKKSADAKEELKTVCCYSSSQDCDSPRDSCSDNVDSCNKCDGKLYSVSGSLHTPVEEETASSSEQTKAVWSQAGQNASESADTKDASVAQNAAVFLAADTKGDDRSSRTKAARRGKQTDVVDNKSADKKADSKTVCCYSSSEDCDSPRDFCSANADSCKRCDGKLYAVSGSLHTLVEPGNQSLSNPGVSESTDLQVFPDASDVAVMLASGEADDHTGASQSKAAHHKEEEATNHSGKDINETKDVKSNHSRDEARCCYSFDKKKGPTSCEHKGDFCAKDEAKCKDCGGHWYPANYTFTAPGNSSDKSKPKSGSHAQKRVEQPVARCCYSFDKKKGPTSCEHEGDFCAKDEAKCKDCGGHWYPANYTSVATRKTSKEGAENRTKSSIEQSSNRTELSGNALREDRKERHAEPGNQSLSNPDVSESTDLQVFSDTSDVAVMLASVEADDHAGAIQSKAVHHKEEEATNHSRKDINETKDAKSNHSREEARCCYSFDKKKGPTSCEHKGDFCAKDKAKCKDCGGHWYPANYTFAAPGNSSDKSKPKSGSHAQKHVEQPVARCCYSFDKKKGPTKCEHEGDICAKDEARCMDCGGHWYPANYTFVSAGKTSKEGAGHHTKSSTGQSSNRTELSGNALRESRKERSVSAFLAAGGAPVELPAAFAAGLLVLAATSAGAIVLERRCRPVVRMPTAALG